MNTFPELDIATYEIAGVTVRLRDEVVCWTRDESGEVPTFVVEDLKTGRFFRVGLAEFTLLSLLNGQCTLGEALAETSRWLGPNALTETEAASLCRWLIEQELVTTTAAESLERLRDRERQKREQSRMLWLNPMMLQVPLFSPDVVFQWLNRLCGWAISLPLLAVWCVVCGWGVFSVVTDWDRFMSQGGGLLDRHNWIGLILTSVVLKLLHEVVHGVCCRRFGGEVRSCGVLFLLFLPLPFVDVTSSQRFVLRSERMLVAAAGMLMEFFLAAIAAIVWRNTDSPFLSMHMANVIVAASVTTLLFNANPLMRFDGYHLLADWLNLPNLSTRGRGWVLGTLRSIFFGERRPVGVWNDRHEWLLPLYGIASVSWMVLVSVSITAAAANLLPGIGLLFAILSATMWLMVPAYRMVRRALSGEQSTRAGWLRCAVVSSSLLLGLWFGSGELPAPRGIAVPCVIDYEPRYEVRNQSAGFVDQVHVEANSVLREGEALLRLRNEDLIADAAQLQIMLDESQLKLRLHQLQGRVALALAERENQQAIETRLADLRERVERLEVRAPVDGEFIEENWTQLPGRFCPPGTLLATLGNEEEKQAILMIPQEFMHRIETPRVASETTGHLDPVSHTGIEPSTTSLVQLHMEGMGVLVGECRVIEPIATASLPHLALGVPGGGSLAMRPAAYPTERGDGRNGEWELLAPQILARVALSRSDSLRLHAGQTGFAFLHCRQESLRSYLRREFQVWYESKFTESHGF